MKKLLSIFLVIVMLLSILPTWIIGVAADTGSDNRGTAFTAGASTRVPFTAGSYESISFDYKLTTEGTMSIIVRAPGDVPFYGDFSFNAQGVNGSYAGITCEALEDGYVRATLVLDELGRTNCNNDRNNVPATVSLIDVYSWTTADGYIDNVQCVAAEPEVTEPEVTET